MLAHPELAYMFGPQLLQDLKDDLPSLFSLYASLGQPTPNMDPDQLLEFWRTRGHEAKSWAKAAQIFCLALPNSVLAERAGSKTRARISDQQSGKMLDDTFEYCAISSFRYGEMRARERAE